MADLYYARQVELESSASSRTLTSSPLAIDTAALGRHKATAISTVHFAAVAAIAPAITLVVALCLRRILARPVDGYSSRRHAGSTGGGDQPKGGGDGNLLDPSEGMPRSTEFLLRLDAAAQALRAAMQTNREDSSPRSAAALTLAMANAKELLLSVNEQLGLGSLDVATPAGQHALHAANILGDLQEEAQASMASAALAESLEASSTAEPGPSSAPTPTPKKAAPSGSKKSDPSSPAAPASGAPSAPADKKADSSSGEGGSAHVARLLEQAEEEVTALNELIVEAFVLSPKEACPPLYDQVVRLDDTVTTLCRLFKEPGVSGEDVQRITDMVYRIDEASEAAETILKQKGWPVPNKDDQDD